MKHHKSKKLFRQFVSILVSLLILATASLVFVKLTARADTYIGFDEGYGSTVHDTEGTASGTITNAVWRQEGECASGKCLYFDGTGDYVSFTDDANFDFAETANFTIEFWFRTPDISSGTRIFVSKYRGDDTEGGYKVYMNSSGQVVFGIDDDNSFGPDDAATSVSAYDDSKWHHVVATKTGTTNLTLYIDSIRVAQDVSISAVSTLVNDDILAVGTEYDGTTNPYTGYIDELKIFIFINKTHQTIRNNHRH